MFEVIPLFMAKTNFVFSVNVMDDFMPAITPSFFKIFEAVINPLISSLISLFTKILKA